ncbi:hypothetical protein M0R45_026220 [Rubus argutus]|uniref:Uncharacterized protein n=1 Tax=Rubus argutus TaxID=59490 RepID=A0AAW1WXK3_RUBAR
MPSAIPVLPLDHHYSTTSLLLCPLRRRNSTASISAILRRQQPSRNSSICSCPLSPNQRRLSLLPNPSLSISPVMPRSPATPPCPFCHEPSPAGFRSTDPPVLVATTTAASSNHLISVLLHRARALVLSLLVPPLLSPHRQPNLAKNSLSAHLARVGPEPSQNRFSLISECPATHLIDPYQPSLLLTASSRRCSSRPRPRRCSLAATVVVAPKPITSVLPRDRTQSQLPKSTQSPPHLLRSCTIIVVTPPCSATKNRSATVAVESSFTTPSLSLCSAQKFQTAAAHRRQPIPCSSPRRRCLLSTPQPPASIPPSIPHSIFL